MAGLDPAIHAFATLKQPQKELQKEMLDPVGAARG
jgi:hypothetical protein